MFKTWVAKLFFPRKMTGLRAARDKIVSGILNSINYGVICMVYTQFTNVVAGRIIHPGGPRVGQPWFKRIRLFRICFRNKTDSRNRSVIFKKCKKLAMVQQLSAD